MAGIDPDAPIAPLPNEPVAPSDAAEERLLRRLRVIAGGVILLMIVLLVTVDTLGRLLVDPNFHIDEISLGTLIGALLLLLGVEGVNRLPVEVRLGRKK